MHDGPQLRQSLVEPLVREFHEREISSWFDLHEIALGDSIVAGIQGGMASSALVLAVISPDYLRRPWPLKELRTALALETTKQISILPVLVGVTCDEVFREFPFLAEIRHFAIPRLSSSEVVSPELLKRLVAEVADAIAKRLRIEVLQSYDVGQLDGPARLIRYGSVYTTVTCMNEGQFLDVLCHPRLPTARRHPTQIAEPLSIPTLLERLLKSGRGERPVVKCADVAGNLLVVVLSDGSVLCSGSGYFRDGQLSRIEHLGTDCPPDPAIMHLTDDLDVIIGYQSGGLRVVPLVGAKYHTHSLVGHTGDVRGIASSRRSRLFVIADPRSLSVWSRDQYQLVRVLQDLGSPGRSIAISGSPFDRSVGVGHEDGSITLWDFDGTLKSRFLTGDYGLGAIKFLPGPGKFLVVSGSSGLSIWDYEKGSRMCQLSTAQSGITALDCQAFDERLGCAHLVVGAGFADGVCKIWELGIN